MSENLIATNWVVLTGANSCGKTTIVRKLEELGFQSIPEAGRMLIEREMLLGKTVEEARGDRVAFLKKLFPIKRELEGQLDPNALVVLDRALPDSKAYFRIAGLDPQEVESDCKTHRYREVFILDPLPFEKDGLRDADLPYRHYLNSQLEVDYRALDYDVIRIPVLPVKDRVNMILGRLGLGNMAEQLNAADSRAQAPLNG